MPTKLQNREIYWTAYCCLDGEECELTNGGILKLLELQGMIYWYEFPELWSLSGWEFLPNGSPGWPERKEILLRAIEMTY